MKTSSIAIDKPQLALWENLPIESQQALASKALNALLKGTLYPTGSEQLELAIDLAEAGVDADTISTLSRLNKEVFEGFIPK